MSFPARPSEARERLLRVASELFYREGIHGVGLDRVLTEAGVTRATMYRHFAGKEALVAAYLEREDAAIRAAFPGADELAASRSAQSGRAALDELIEAIADDITRQHDRGCPFINAAAEYPDAASEVRLIVAQHRSWFRDHVARLAAAAGASHPDQLAGALVLLRDGALTGCYLDGLALARPAFVSAARTLTAI